MKSLTAAAAAIVLAATMNTQGQELIRPLTNPVWHGPAGVETSVHPIFMHQALPGKLNTELGNVPADGDFQVYALQFEYAFSPSLSANVASGLIST